MIDNNIKNRPIVANLNTSSHYSILNSTLSIDEIINKAIGNKQEYVSLIDSNLYGAIEFYKKCVSKKIKPILGLNFTNKDINILIIAKNNSGYKNLIKITSNVLKSIEFDINNYLFDVFVINLIGSNFVSDKVDVYFEDQKHENRIAINTAKFAHKDDVDVLNILKYINESKVLSSLDELKQGDDLSLKSIDFINKMFDQQSINNLNKVISNINLVIEFNKNNLMKFPIQNSKITSKIFLKNVCFDNLNQLILEKKIDANLKEKYLNRCEYELNIIDNMGFNDYFLIVQDFINFAKSNNILVGPGRGSVAGSLVAFLLGITSVDSIKYNLIFERFLNPDRQTMPDIDIDIMDSRRNEVIEYIFNKYGYEYVSHITTFQKIKAKMAIRDVGRVLGIDLKIINKISKLISPEFDINFIESFNNSKELKEYKKDYENLFLLSSKIVGCPRQIGIHAAGIVLSNAKLDDIVPTQYTVNNEIVTQYSMEYLEELGLIKMDLLGLTNLSTISNALKLIKYLHNIDINLNEINLNDQSVFELLSKGQTVGIFQLESHGMTNLIKQIKPKDVEDISLCSALFRPGPQQNIKTLLARRNKKEKIEYVHSSLENILLSTYGIIVYQEQVIEIVKIVGNISATEADNFRRIISKKDSSKLENFKKFFKEKSIQNNYSEEEFEKIYNYIYTFANYGFNHSHSLSYSIISYWMTYLKKYYSIEFMVTLMSMFEGVQDKINILVNECKRLKIDVLPPNINESNKSFSLKNNKILMGFNSVKGIGDEISKKIILARKNDSNSKFKDYIDCVKKLSISGVGKQTIITLIYAGMFDCFEYNRKKMINNIDEIISVSKQIKSDGNFLFDPIIEEYKMDDKDKLEFNSKMIDLIGIDLSENQPNIKIEFNNEQLNKINKYQLVNMNNLNDDQINFISLIKIINVKKSFTKQNKPMINISIVDTDDHKHNLNSFSKDIVNFDFEIGSWYIVEIKKNDKWKNISKIKEKI